ncbi:MAG: PilZ domain-containing protein [Gammaproteobacteria bacterium]
MILIENRFTGLKNATAKKTYQVSLLPARLLNSDIRASQSCVITDLSSGGAAVLVPRSQATFEASFDLAFMSPDNNNEILTILPVIQRWRNEQHSPDHIKIGVMFPDMNLIKTQVINAMIEILMLKSNMTRSDSQNTALLVAGTF